VPGTYISDALLTQIETARRIPHRNRHRVLTRRPWDGNVEAIAQSSRRLEALHFASGLRRQRARPHGEHRGRIPITPATSGRPPGTRGHGVPRLRVRAIDGPYGDFKDPAGFVPRPAAAALGLRRQMGDSSVPDRPGQRLFTPPPRVERARRICSRSTKRARRPRRGRSWTAADRRGVGPHGQNIVDTAPRCRPARAPPSALAVTRRSRDIHEYQPRTASGFGVPFPGRRRLQREQAVYRASEVGGTRWV